MSPSRSAPARPTSLPRLGAACLFGAVLCGLATAADAQKDSASGASKAASFASETSVAGYGEIGYNNYVKAQHRNQVDLKRFVVFVGHRFDERWSLNSEVEWEHAVASADDAGETEIEQAYLNYQYAPGFNLKTGLFLMPFGFLNQSHEPPVFSGVERNEVETRIIPTTWREGGIGAYGGTESGLKWDAGIVTGFDVAKFDESASPLAASHQELQLAKAADLSFYAALNYAGLPGFTVGGAAFAGNSFQDNADFKADNSLPDFSGIDGRVLLWDAHTRLQMRGWDVQAIFARGTLDEAEKIDKVLQAYNTAGGTDRPLVPDAFYGWLIQAGYTFWFHGDASLTPFARYEAFDTQAEMPSGIAADAANADKEVTAGFALKPMTQISFKADYQKYLDHGGNDRFNLGLGYMF